MSEWMRVCVRVGYGVGWSDAGMRRGLISEAGIKFNLLNSNLFRQ